MGIETLILSLLLARLLALVIGKFKVPSISAYILTGILVGYSFLNILDYDGSEFLVTLSLLILFFYTGLNVDFKGLTRYFKESLIITVLGVGVTTALTLAVMTSLGFTLIEALVVAVSISNTATEIVVIMLEEVGRVGDALKRTIIMASFIDDMIAVIFVSLIKGLINSDFVEVGYEALRLTAFLAGSLAITYLVITRHSRVFYSLFRSWERILMLSSLIFFGYVALSGYLNLGLIFGAYAAGLIMSVLRMGHDPLLTYESRLEELMTRMATFLELFFIPIFFIYAGSNVRVGDFFTPQTALILTLAFLGKFVGCSLYFILQRDVVMGIKVGVAMNARGSIEPAVALVALNYGAISEATFTGIIAVSLVTSAVIPALFGFIVREFRE